MALRKAGLPVQFRGGLQTKQDHKQVPTTELLDLQNAVFTRQTTLSKRFGYAAKSQAIDGAGSDYVNAVGLGVRDSELLLFTDDHCYSHRPSFDRWSDAGEVSGVACTDVPIARTGTQQWIPDAGTRGGVTAVAWEDSRGGVWCSVVEDGTGRILLEQTQLDSTGISPRCLEVGGVVIILWMRTATQRIYSAVVDPVNASAVPTPQILTDDLDATTPAFDAMPTYGAYDALSGFTTDRPGAIVWTTAGGYRIGYIHPSGVLGSPVNGLPSVATWADVVTGPIALAVDRTTAYATAVVWGAGSFVRARFHSPSSLLTAMRGATALEFVGILGTSVRLVCEYGKWSTTPGATLYWAIEIQGLTSDLNKIISGAANQNDSTLDTTNTTLRGHTLLTRAFHDGPAVVAGDTTLAGQVYVTVGHFVKLFPYAAVIRLSADDGIAGTNTITSARILPGTALGGLVRTMNTAAEYSRTLPSVEERASTDGDSTGSAAFLSAGSPTSGIGDDEVYSRIHRFPVSVRLQLDSEDGDQFSEIGIRLVELDFDNDNAHQTLQIGRGLYLASACPQHYDGERWVEADVHTAPDWGFNIGTSSWVDPATASFTTQNVGGGMDAGTYLYKLWYEDIDGQGELHSGAPSVGVLVTLAAGFDQVTITIPTLRNTRKRNVRIGVARSEQGQTGTDESIPLYRVSGLDPDVDTGANRYVANDPTADTVTFIDSLSDANLIKREPLYTNGGILPNSPSPWSGTAIASGKSRLFWTDPSDPNLVRFSQQLRDDTGLEAPIDLTLRTDPYGGRILAISVMDEAVYVFKQTAIYVFGGPGPLANPSANPEANAFTLPELVTSDVGCVGPAAIVQTPIGIMFPTNKGIRLLSRQRQIVPIGDPVYTYQSQTFKRATLLPDRPHIVFLTDSGSTLLFDYERGQWSRFTNHEGLDAVMVDGTYHYLRTDGRVFAETVDAYRDDNSQIVMKIETAWIKMIEYLQGWQKVLYANFLGEYQSAHTLRVRYRIDYQAGYSAPYDLDVNVNFDPQLYGEGLYGAGLYGGSEQAGTVYQRRIHLNRRCQSISFLIEDVEATDAFGASFELSELLLSGGVLGPEFKMGAARSS